MLCTVNLQSKLLSRLVGTLREETQMEGASLKQSSIPLLATAMLGPSQLVAVFSSQYEPSPSIFVFTTHASLPVDVSGQISLASQLSSYAENLERKVNDGSIEPSYACWLYGRGLLAQDTGDTSRNFFSAAELLGRLRQLKSHDYYSIWAWSVMPPPTSSLTHCYSTRKALDLRPPMLFPAGRISCMEPKICTRPSAIIGCAQHPKELRW
jgi:hypothetical protein